MTEFSEFFADAFDDLLAIHGEQVTYKPVAGSNRTINAIVDRNPPAVYVGTDVVQPKLTVRVHEDSTVGISASELNTGGDKINVAQRKGGTAADYMIAVPDEQDAGVLVVALV